MASAFQHYVQPAQQFFGYQKQPYYHTQYEQLDSSQSSPYTPHSATMYTPSYPMENKNTPPVNHRRLKRFKKLQRITGIVFGIADVCSCALTVLIESVMVFVLVKFYQTKNMPAPGRSGPWAKDTKLWPTYMLAGAALATFFLALSSLILSCRKRKSATKARLTIKVIRIVILVASWIAVAAFYRVAKTGNDLWGWSCDDRAAAIQKYYISTLNFDSLCKVQTGSWFVSITEVVIKIILAIIGFYFQFKLEGLKRDVLKDSGEVGWETFQNLSG